MSDRTCPKCGAKELFTAGNRTRFECDAVLNHTTGKLDGRVATQCFANELAAMTARAEKAEALAQYRLEALEARDRAAQYFETLSETGYCWYCHTDACEDCAPNCPTVTHPKEGLE